MVMFQDIDVLMARIKALCVYNFILAPLFLYYGTYAGPLWTIGFLLALERVYSLAKNYVLTLHFYFEDGVLEKNGIFACVIGLLVIVVWVPIYHVIYFVRLSFASNDELMAQ